MSFLWISVFALVCFGTTESTYRSPRKRPHNPGSTINLNKPTPEPGVLFDRGYYTQLGDGGSHFRRGIRTEDGLVRGSYGIQAPEGHTRVVYYQADGNGAKYWVKTNEPGTSSKASPADADYSSVNANDVRTSHDLNKSFLEIFNEGTRDDLEHQRASNHRRSHGGKEADISYGNSQSYQQRDTKDRSSGYGDQKQHKGGSYNVGNANKNQPASNYKTGGKVSYNKPIDNKGHGGSYNVENSYKNQLDISHGEGQSYQQRNSKSGQVGYGEQKGSGKSHNLESSHKRQPDISYGKSQGSQQRNAKRGQGSYGEQKSNGKSYNLDSYQKEQPDISYGKGQGYQQRNTKSGQLDYSGQKSNGKAYNVESSHKNQPDTSYGKSESYQQRNTQSGQASYEQKSNGRAYNLKSSQKKQPTTSYGKSESYQQRNTQSGQASYEQKSNGKAYNLKSSQKKQPDISYGKGQGYQERNTKIGQISYGEQKNNRKTYKLESSQKKQPATSYGKGQEYQQRNTKSGQVSYSEQKSNGKAHNLESSRKEQPAKSYGKSQRYQQKDTKSYTSRGGNKGDRSQVLHAPKYEKTQSYQAKDTKSKHIGYDDKDVSDKSNQDAHGYQQNVNKEGYSAFGKGKDNFEKSIKTQHGQSKPNGNRRGYAQTTKGYVTYSEEIDGQDLGRPYNKEYNQQNKPKSDQSYEQKGQRSRDDQKYVSDLGGPYNIEESHQSYGPDGNEERGKSVAWSYVNNNGYSNTIIHNEDGKNVGDWQSAEQYGRKDVGNSGYEDTLDYGENNNYQTQHDEGYNQGQQPPLRRVIVKKVRGQSGKICTCRE